jgi:Flp pilus assembly pilin Flp
MTVQFITTLLAFVRDRARAAQSDDGATAIEWAIFALIALAVAAAVGAAITLAVNNRIPGIQ